MLLDLSKQFDINKAKNYLDKLIKSSSKIELKALSNKRSISQNSYLHVCISLFGIEFGYTLNEAKTLLKRECPFMRYEKKGTIFLKSTITDSKGLTEFIEWIRVYSSMQGFYIPTSKEYQQEKFYIDKQINEHKKYL